VCRAARDSKHLQRTDRLDRTAVGQSAEAWHYGAPNNLLFVIDVCAKVRAVLSECTCSDQFPMIRVAEGKYRIGETQTLVFLRVSIITSNYLRQRRRYMFLAVFVCLSVCLSVSKITQKRVHGFG